MASFNRVILIGNVTRDIELKYTQGGAAVCEMGLAVNERIKRGEEWVEEATFVDVTLWARTAEVASEFLKKGSPVFVEGRLKLDTWESDGQKRSKLRVVGEKIQLLGGKPTGERRSRDEAQSEPGEEAYSPGGGGGDDIPFAWAGLFLPLATAALSWIA